MKTQRTLIVVLSLLAVGLAYLAWSGHTKPPVEVVKEMWHTNTVERWRTNTVEKWFTNDLQVSRTSTLVQPVTNEVIKEVPAKLSDLERRAATAGYRYINAPLLENASDALYKAGPVTVEANIDDSTGKIIPEDQAAIKKRVGDALQSRSIPVAEKAPHVLKLNIGRQWATDVPGVSLLVYKLELKDNVALQRQNEIIRCSGVIWSTTTYKLARGFNIADEVNSGLQQPVDKFCNDYLKAKGAEKTVEARIPSIPHDFLPEGR